VSVNVLFRRRSKSASLIESKDEEDETDDLCQHSFEDSTSSEKDETQSYSLEHLNYDLHRGILT